MSAPQKFRSLPSSPPSSWRTPSSALRWPDNVSWGRKRIGRRMLHWGERRGGSRTFLPLLQPKRERARLLRYKHRYVSICSVIMDHGHLRSCSYWNVTENMYRVCKNTREDVNPYLLLLNPGPELGLFFVVRRRSKISATDMAHNDFDMRRQWRTRRLYFSVGFCETRYITWLIDHIWEAFHKIHLIRYWCRSYSASQDAADATCGYIGVWVSLTI